jgi:hypothetical protein
MPGGHVSIKGTVTYPDFVFLSDKQNPSIFLARVRFRKLEPAIIENNGVLVRPLSVNNNPVPSTVRLNGIVETSCISYGKKNGIVYISNGF